jgi:alkanesulfonate monooxygenase SsuD/methylene tetrahydromethanopterin reductase-like flavin-dependent oxidoreductase (luciferase family)
MEEMVNVMRKLWSGGMVEHHGEFLDFPRLEINPAPQTSIPVYLSGSSPIALKRAARCADGWIGPGNTADEVVAILGQFSRLRVKAGRDRQSFETIIPLTEPAEPDTLRRLEEKGMTASVNFPFAFSIGQKSSLDEKKRSMEHFAKTVIEPMSR